MIGEVQVTRPTEEEALEEAVSLLRAPREAVDFEVRREAAEDLLPDARPEVVVRAWIRPEFVAEQARERTHGLVSRMGFEPEVKVKVDGRVVRVDVSVDGESSLLIGRDGQNLDALQYLVSRMILKLGREAPMLILDVEGYRRRQYKDLEKLVERAVARARESGNEIELDPMPAADRKYLHHFLSNFPDVKTFSRGEEPERYLVIVAD